MKRNRFDYLFTYTEHAVLDRRIVDDLGPGLAAPTQHAVEKHRRAYPHEEHLRRAHAHPLGRLVVVRARTVKRADRM